MIFDIDVVTLRGKQGDKQDLGVAPDGLPDCRVRVCTHVVGE